MEDKEAYSALWGAICDAADKLAGRCQVYLSKTPDSGSRIGRGFPALEVETWQMVEALSLMMILIRASEVHSTDVVNLFGRIGPLHFVEDKRDCYLWAQSTLLGEESGLGGRPDIVITSSPNKPSTETILRIIECKCRKRLGTHEIRAEFGKAFDLKVVSYLIWSYITPAQRIIEGAKKLGLDLIPLGFDTPRRADLIARPENLQAHISNTLEASRREERFAKALVKVGKDVASKASMLELFRDEKERG